MKSLKYTCSCCANVNNDFLYRKNEFNIYKCTICGLAFTEVPKDFNFSEYYSEKYFQGGDRYGYYDYKSSENVLRKEFSNVLAFLRKRLSNKSGLRLLEVGSAYGYFLEIASEYFESTGLEISEHASRIALEKGLNVYNSTINQEILQKVGYFDVIVLLDVIEHLSDLNTTFNLLANHLNSNGYILITTGNFSSLLSRIMGRNWRLLTPPQHLYFFNKKNIAKLLNKYGFEIVEINVPWKIVPLGLAIYQVLRRIFKKITINNNLNRIAVPINLFDTMRILARKKS